MSTDVTCDGQKQFNTASSASLNEAEKALKTWGIEYEKKPDGTLFVPGNVDISKKGLTELPDLSCVAVGGWFACYSNMLTSLKGAPQYVGGTFYGDNNQLTTLAGAPPFVGDCFYCSGTNQLTSLEGAPKTFRTLKTNLGEFSSWEQVPEHLRISPETKARLAQEAEAAICGPIVLQNDVRVKGPLTFKRR